ncbi:MAG TPA: phosphodiester glycosidase family protein [Pseudobacteroides sp.]|uniref:phosphodiester glycosidase family protein n=1 Tax=Pseudobacteroides sp. TaxID=1968840 RepID=UPI002F95AD79
MLLFTIFISLMFYSNIGFFRELRELYVGTAMSTFTHQYLATTFISKDEIDRIMKKNTVPIQTVKSNINEIKLEDDEREEDTEVTKELDIEMVDISESTFSGKMLIVKDPSRVKLAVTNKLYSRGQKLQEMIKAESGIGGINASGFIDAEGRGNGGVPMGIVIKDGKIVHSDKSSAFPIIGFNKDNILIVGRYKKSEIESLNLRDAVSFTPFLIVNGEPQIKTGNGGWGIQPRTAIGQTKDGKVLMLVIDGRQISSIGATLKNVQDIMLEHGAYNAANLDGGSSTVMYYMDNLQNKPCSSAGERYLPDAFIIK